MRGTHPGSLTGRQRVAPRRAATVLTRLAWTLALLGLGALLAAAAVSLRHHKGDAGERQAELPPAPAVAVSTARTPQADVLPAVPTEAPGNEVDSASAQREAGETPRSNTQTPAPDAKKAAEPKPAARVIGRETVLTKGKTTQRLVSLTIDLGETATRPAVTEILDYTKQHHIPCAWFVTGWFIRKFPDLIEKFAARGDEIGNHTNTHPHCTEMSRARLEGELRAVEEGLEKLDLRITTPAFFRPPFGEYDAGVVKTAASLGYTTVTWTATSIDYERNADSDYVAKVILKHTVPGAVILTHASDVSRRTIPKVAEELTARGYRFVSLRELAALKEGD
jgi:peptidoglycan-N-acetylmuramic acid deacetylase